MPPMLAAQSEGRAKEDSQRSAAKGSKKGGSLRDLAYRFEPMPKNRSGLDADSPELPRPRTKHRGLSRGDVCRTTLLGTTGNKGKKKEPEPREAPASTSPVRPKG
jgi:hypothetical protein